MCNVNQIMQPDTVEPVLGDHPFCQAKVITGRTKIMFYQCVHVYT